MIFSLNTKEWDINKEGVTMFEQEANEYAKENKKVYGSDEYANITDYNNVKKAFQKGAEFGYNKSNEWHYPLKGEYPKEYKDLWICFVTEDDMKDYVRGWYEYDFDEGKHIFKTVNETTWNLENVYAWKEIVFPEMEEEINDLS